MKSPKHRLSAPSLLLWFALCLPGLFNHSARADPPEGVLAWPGPPQGFHLGELGPRTVPVARSDYARVLHVSAGKGSDETGRGTPDAPWATLGRALDAAGTATPRSRVAILVAGGTYPGGPWIMKPWVDLFGGFSDTTWERDIHKHPSILDGRKQNRLLIGADHATLDGFVLTRGRQAGPGGALLCESTSPMITNNVFRDNATLAPENPEPYSRHHSWPRVPEGGYDPARMQERHGHTTHRLRLPGNIGGAIGLVNFANPGIRHNLFVANATGFGNGGAIGMDLDCLPAIGFNVFWGNSAGVQDTHATRSGNGGAISIVRNSRPAILHNLFVANEALGKSDGGALYCEFFARPEIRWNVFLDNFAEDDGAVLESQRFSRPFLYANLMYGNRVRTGVISQDESFYVLENNIIAHNSGDAIITALSSLHGMFRATNNTIVANTSTRPDAPAVYHVNSKSSDLRAPDVQNNIIWGNRPVQVRFESEATVRYNLIEGGHPGYGNLDREPAFIRDGRRFTVVSGGPEETGFTTSLVVAGDDVASVSLQHRLVRLGSRWSLVRTHEGTRLTLWGLLPVENGGTLEVLPTYHLSDESAAIAKGQHLVFPSRDIDGDLRMEPCIDIGADQFIPEVPRPDRGG